MATSLGDLGSKIKETADDVTTTVLPGFTDDGKAPGISPLITNIPDVVLDVGEDALATAMGFLNGASLGLFGELVKLTPLESEWKGLRERNPSATNFGEFASILSPGATLKLAKWGIKGILRGGKALTALKAGDDAVVKNIIKTVKGKGKKLAPSELKEINKNLSAALKNNPKKVEKILNASKAAVKSPGQKAVDAISWMEKQISLKVSGANTFQRITNSIMGVPASAGASFLVAYRAARENGADHSDALQLAAVTAAGAGLGAGVATAARWNKFGRKIFGNPGRSGLDRQTHAFIAELAAKIVGYHFIADTPINKYLRGEDDANHSNTGGPIFGMPMSMGHNQVPYIKRKGIMRY